MQFSCLREREKCLTLAAYFLHSGPLASLPLTLSLVSSQTSPVASGSTWPGMWHDWILDLQWIVNNRQLYVMISEQDEVLLSYVIDLKVSEGE